MLDLLERRGTIGCQANFAVEAAQVRLDKLSIGKAVVNYQYDRHYLAALPRLLTESRGDIVASNV